jgi:hypothetical protein
MMAETLGDEMVGMLAHLLVAPKVALMDVQRAGYLVDSTVDSKAATKADVMVHSLAGQSAETRAGY